MDKRFDGAKLRQLREDAEMSQTDLCLAMRETNPALRPSPTWISRIERRVVTPSLPSLLAISGALLVDMNAFLTEVEPE